MSTSKLWVQEHCPWKRSSMVWTGLRSWVCLADSSTAGGLLVWTGTGDLGNICWVNVVAQPVRTCIGLFGLGPFGSRIGIAVAAFRFCALGCSCAVSSDESDIFHRQCDFRSWGGASSMPGIFSESSGSCRRRAAAGGLSLRSRRGVSIGSLRGGAHGNFLSCRISMVDVGLRWKSWRLCLAQAGLLRLR